MKILTSPEQDIRDYIAWHKSEFGTNPDIHLDEVIDLIERI